MIFGSYLLGEGSDSHPQRRRRAGDRRGDRAAGLDPAAEVAGAARHARRHHDAQHGGLPRPPQRGDRRPGHGRAQRLRDLVPARARRQGRAVPDVRRARRRLRRTPDRRRQRCRLSGGAGELPFRVPRLGVSRARRSATPSIPIPAGPGAGAAAAASSASWRCWRRKPWSPCASTASSIRPGASPAGMRRVPGGASSIRAAPDERILRPLSDGNIVKRGDIVRIETGGGGGWGHPFDREPERVPADVRGGFVSRASAEEHYGVVLAADGIVRRCGGHRQARRARRPEAKLFHRHGYHDGARLMATPRSDQGRASSSASTRAARSPTSRCSIRRRAGVWTAKTPSTPDDPSRGFGNGIAEVLKIAGLAGRRHRPRAARHDGCHQPDPRGQGRARRAHHHRRLQVRAGDRPPGRAAPRQPVRLGEAEAPGPARAHLRGRRAHRARRPRARSRSTRRPCARPRGAIARRASARSPSCCCTATPTRRTSGASPPILAEELPGALVSLSSEVLPVFREYERSMTTILNASVMPVVSTYVERLDARIAEQGIAAPLLLMKSSGGVTSTRTVRRAPVETALSGPAAGAVGAAYVGASSGHHEPDRHRHRRHLGRHQPDPRRRARPHHQRPHRRLAGRPAHDRHRHDRGGRRLHRARLGHGRADRRAAERGRRAGPRLLPPRRRRADRDGRASGARSSAALSARRQLRARCRGGARGDPRAHRRAARPERGSRRARHPRHRRQQHGGRHPRGVGGARPRPARFLAAALRRRRAAARRRAGAAARHATIVVPPGPGVLSALGLLVSNLKAEFTRTCLQKAGAFDAGAVARVFGELDAEARAWLDAEDVPAEARAHRLVREPALPAPGLRAHSCPGPAATSRRPRPRRRSPPSTGCTSGSTPSPRRTRRSRS